MSIGFSYTCFNETKAVEHSIIELRKVYPTAPVFLTSDGGIDFSYLEEKYNIKTYMGEDTFSDILHPRNMSHDQFAKTYKIKEHQDIIKKCINGTLDRLKMAISYCDTDYIVMMDPDALVRGKLTIPKDSTLLGSRINHGLPQTYKDILLNINGAKVIDTWGATPGIFHTKTYLQCLPLLTKDRLDQFCQSFYAMYAHDVLLPTIFALGGHEEQYNPDVCQCISDRSWPHNGKPLLHQFRKYY